MENEKVDLFRKYRETGDVALRNEIVMAYTDTVRLSAMSLRNSCTQSYDLDDLVNEGVIALIAAVESFDLKRGVKFETYANLKIKGAIIDYIRKQDWIPRSVRKFSKELEDAYSYMYHTLGRHPKNQELAEYMGVTREQFAKRLADAATLNTLSFEELLYEDNLNEYNAESLVESRVYAEERKQVIADAISELKPNVQKVVSLYYYEDMKLREVAEIIGVSESRACQIHSKAMLLLKQKLEDYIKK